MVTPIRIVQVPFYLVRQTFEIEYLIPDQPGPTFFCLRLMIKTAYPMNAKTPAVFTPLLLILCSLFLASCMGVMKNTIKEDDKQIPTGFGKEDVTLLVVRKGSRIYDKYLEKNFAENYKGKYVIVEPGEERTKRYADKKKYRYIFSEDQITQTRTKGVYQGAARVRTEVDNTTIAKFQLEDRLTGEVYRTKHGTAAYSAWMRSYIQALEKARLKNKQS